MTQEQPTLRDGDIRAQVLEKASAQLAESDVVPEALLAELKLTLADERPPKAAALVALIENHFKGTVS